MFDFRYHALSLVAVFLALGIGILLGVTIGDSLVSDAERNIRNSLRGDVVEARDDAERAREELERRDELIADALPILADARLRGRAVAVVGLGSLPRGVERTVRDSVELAEGELDSTSRVEVPGDLEELGDAVGGRFARIEAGDRVAPGGRLVRRLGRRIGRSLVLGDALAGRLAEELGERFGGEYAGADAVVVYRSPEKRGRDDDEEGLRALRESFEEGLLQGVKRAGTTIVGVEEWDAEPSQVPWYEDHDLSSVDSVDLAGGRAALVLALDGAEGTFGLKRTADKPLPESPTPGSPR
jgi:hypothetical protein